MSAQAWTIVGVIVGAVVGGAAQVVAQLIRDHTTRRDKRSDARQDAYADFMTAARSFETGLRRLAIDLETLNPGDAAPDFRKAYLEVRGSADRTLSMIEILAPHDTYATARDLWGSLASIAGQLEDRIGKASHDIDFELAHKARTAFTENVKRDLGLE